MAEKEAVKGKIEQKIAQQFSDYIAVSPDEETKSREYQQFKKDNVSIVDSFYEKACLYFGKFPGFNPGKDLYEKIEKSLKTCHLSLRVQDVTAFALYGPILLAIALAVLAGVVTQDFLMVVLSFIGGICMIYPSLYYPMYLADNWRMKAGNQMVLAVFYVVTYMRHTSNLERAIEFASDHINPPLSLDFRKILWDVETGKYESVEASLENYLLDWKGSNDQFIEAMHLVESSLYEEQESRRLEVLDKSLDVVLEQTYERMLHYAHNLQSPITTLHMLGVILPILGLVILPLMIAFMPEVRWYHVSVLYNIVFPILVFVLGMKILAQRPSGFGGSNVDDVADKSKEFLFGKSFAFVVCVAIIVIGVIGGLSPVWIKWIAPEFDIGFGKNDPGSDCAKQFCLLGYHVDVKENSPTQGEVIGPYGIGASLISLLIPLCLGIGLGLYYRMRSTDVIKIRRETEQLESEFGAALFQLGNRLDDGTPSESAVATIGNNLPDTVSGNFFRYVTANIQKLGMSLQEAIFNPQVGAILRYPSHLIESSMKVLVEASKKGPRIASRALTSISLYLKEMHKVDERLQDLMAEVLSSMRSQINFLTPIIAGIVIGITSMITNILSQLTRQIGGVTQSVGSGATVGGGALNLADIFSEGMPTYFFQLIVGLYVVQIVFILSILINRIKNGVDPLEERYLLGINMLKSVLLYVAVAGIVMLLFNTIASNILARSLG